MSRMNRIIGLLVLVVVSVASTGCRSRTKVVLGPVAVGGQTQAHEWRAPSATFTPNKVGFTLGHVSVYVQSEVTDCTQVIGLESITGETSKVEDDSTATFNSDSTATN